MTYLSRAQVYDAAGIGPSDGVPDDLFTAFMWRVQRALADKPLPGISSPEPFTDAAGGFHQGKLAALMRLPAGAGEAQILAEMRRHHATFNPNSERERNLAQAMTVAEMSEERIKFALKMEAIGGPGPLSFAAGKKDARQSVDALTALVTDYRRQHPNLTFDQAWNLAVVPHLAAPAAPSTEQLTALHARQSFNESVTALSAEVEAYRKEYGVDFTTAFNAVQLAKSESAAPKLTALIGTPTPVHTLHFAGGFNIRDAIAAGKR